MFINIGKPFNVFYQLFFVNMPTKVKKRLSQKDGLYFYAAILGFGIFNVFRIEIALFFVFGYSKMAKTQ